MLSDRTCEKYKEWKKEQKHLKDTKKKIKRKSKKVTTDCIEEEKKAKTIIKIRYRKCEKNGKEKRREEKGIFKPKPISSIDLLFKRIKPSLEVRHQFLDPRHIHCFIESLPEIDLKEIAQREKKKTEQKYLKRRKKKRKKKISEEEKAIDRKEETKLQENSAPTANEESNETKEETANGKITKKKKKNDEQSTEKNRKKIRKKDKFWCKKYQKKIESESEDSECESICSYDSEICLKGLALTVEDKKKIEENRQRVQSSSEG
ncbi:protein PXR1-like [Vespa velutina]|uniref:protein PXR1-like n=1 Tax=Vespa velutina TaxID=202808 RepID=UPI001FB56868|nr:protein PXR1-like [Vespa velutina]